MKTNKNNNEFTFAITKSIAVLRTTPSGWTRELNLVSWNGDEPKYDIRDWNPDHTKMTRGITLTDAEMNVLISALMPRQSTPKKTEAKKSEPKKTEAKKAEKTEVKETKKSPAKKKAASKKPAKKNAEEKQLTLSQIAEGLF